MKEKEAKQEEADEEADEEAEEMEEEGKRSGAGLMMLRGSSGLIVFQHMNELHLRCESILSN